MEYNFPRHLTVYFRWTNREHGVSFLLTKVLTNRRMIKHGTTAKTKNSDNRSIPVLRTKTVSRNNRNTCAAHYSIRPQKNGPTILTSIAATATAISLFLFLCIAFAATLVNGFRFSLLFSLDLFSFSQPSQNVRYSYRTTGRSL